MATVVFRPRRYQMIRASGSKWSRFSHSSRISQSGLSSMSCHGIGANGRSSMETRLKFPANIAAYVGHIAIRLAVMGMEAWERPARPDEIGQMCGLLDDALGAGALGLSTNLFDHDGRD